MENYREDQAERDGDEKPETGLRDPGHDGDHHADRNYSPNPAFYRDFIDAWSPVRVHGSKA